MCVCVYTHDTFTVYILEKNVSCAGAIETKSSMLYVFASLKQLHYHVCFWLLLFYLWVAQSSLSEKKTRRWMQGDVEEQPSVVLVRTAGAVRPHLGCFFHTVTSLSFRTSFPGGAESCHQIRCSEDIIEWRSVILLDTAGSEPLATT